MVPDLLFRRVDQIQLADLLALVDPTARRRWSEVSRQLAMDAGCKLAPTVDAARAAVEARLKAAAPHHRSRNTLPEGDRLLC